MRRTDPVKVIEVGGRNAGWLAARERPVPPGLLSAPDAYPSDGFRRYAQPLTGSLHEDAVTLL